VKVDGDELEEELFDEQDEEGGKQGLHDPVDVDPVPLGRVHRSTDDAQHDPSKYDLQERLDVAEDRHQKLRTCHERKTGQTKGLKGDTAVLVHTSTYDLTFSGTLPIEYKMILTGTTEKYRSVHAVWYVVRMDTGD
jgi:hypothetical protein